MKALLIEELQGGFIYKCRLSNNNVLIVQMTGLPHITAYGKSYSNAKGDYITFLIDDYQLEEIQP